MLLLWEYFWTEADWVPGTASATATASISITTGLSNAGGGGWKQGKRGSRYSEQLSDDYWDTRERYLRKLTYTPPDKPLPVPDKIITTVKAKPPANATLHEQQAYAIATARLANTRSDLIRIGSIISDITTKINQFENDEIRLLFMVVEQEQQLFARLSALITQS